MNCEECGSLYFADRESLEYHMQTHHDSSLYSEAPSDFGYFIF